jgi:hypothetical protein
MNYAVATWSIIGWAILWSTISYAIGKPDELLAGSTCSKCSEPPLGG